MLSKILFFLVLFGLTQPLAWAVTAPTAQEGRALELQRQADERKNWLEERRLFYFDSVSFEVALKLEEQDELEKITRNYQGRFLTQREVEELFGKVKGVYRRFSDGKKSVSCEIINSVFRIYIEP